MLLPEAVKKELARDVGEEHVARVVSFTDEKLKEFEANYDKLLAKQVQDAEERQRIKDSSEEFNFEMQKQLVRIRDQITL